jgi:hypothetical protein
MAPISIADGLPFVSVTIYANGSSMVLDNVLLDTASAACAFPTDALEEIGVKLEPGDTIQEMVGIGGSEYVVEKRITGIAVGDLVSGEIIVQLGKLGYIASVNGILGLDFLLQTGAVIDLKTLDIRKG